MKITPLRIIFIIAVILLSIVSGFLYSGYQDTKTQQAEAYKKAAIVNANLKFKTFQTRAKKARSRGDMTAFRNHYRQAADVLEADLKATSSDVIADLIFNIFYNLNETTRDKDQQIYYLNYMSAKALDDIRLDIINRIIFDKRQLTEDHVTLLCKINKQAINDNNLRTLLAVMRLVETTRFSQVKICVGLSFDDLKARFLAQVKANPRDLTSGDLLDIINFLRLNIKSDKSDDYKSVLLPLLFDRSNYQAVFVHSLTRYLDKWGDDEYRRKLIHVLEKSDDQTGRILFLRGQFYRSQYMEIPDYDRARDMYQKAMSSLYIDAAIPLFHLQYLGLGGSIDKVVANQTLDTALEHDILEAKVIDLCLTLSGSRKKIFFEPINERLEGLLWSENARALKAFMAYWGVIDDLSPRQAFTVMEDAALDDIEWGYAGMALFNESGYGAAKNLNYAKTWRDKIGQSEGVIPTLSVPIDDCRPRAK